MSTPDDPAGPPDADEAEFRLGAGFDFTDPRSPLAPLYCRSGHIAAVVLLGLVFSLMTHMPVWHTDIWGHLRFGEEIVQNRRLPTREVFSGSFADQEALYINYQWISQAGAYLVFDLGRRLAAPTPEAQLGGGALCLATAHAVIVTLRLLLLLLVFHRLTGSITSSLFGVLLVLGMGVPCHLFILRPQILGELAFAALLLPLSRPVLSRRALILIPLLFVLWVNTHGSFLVGFVLLGIFLVGQFGEVVRRSGLDRGAILGDCQLRRLALVMALSVVAAALLNPHGPALFLYTWQLSSHPNIRFLEEWKLLPLRQPPGYIFLGSLLCVGILFRWSKAPWTVTQVLLLVVFGCQTILHLRVFVWWAMVLPWVALPHVHSVWQRWRLPRPGETDQLSLRKTIFAGLAVVSLGLWATPIQWLVWGEAPVGSKQVTEVTPVKASVYLRKQFEADRSLSRCVFTSETMGEYLLWDLRHLDPPVRIFCYTHVHLLTPEHWLECMHVKNGDPGWQEILDRNGVTFLVVEPDLHTRLAAQVRAARDRWEIVPAMEPLLVARRK